MKRAYLITALLYCVLSTALVSQTANPWLIEDARHAKVLGVLVEPCTSARWSGNVDSQGYATGSGTLEMRGNHDRRDVWSGTMKRGMPATGKYRWITGGTFAGDEFVGSWKDGFRNGRGTYLFHDGSRYVGDFVNGKRYGNGVLYKPDGTIGYSGKWVADSPVGAEAAWLSAAIDAHGVRRRGSEYVGRAPWMNDVIHTVGLNYPLSERAQHHTGSGLLRLTLDLKTGGVKQVSLIRSTGFPALDYSATTSFRQWRWKPGRWQEIDIPITFTLTRAEPAGTYIGPPAVVRPK